MTVATLSHIAIETIGRKSDLKTQVSHVAIETIGKKTDTHLMVSHVAIETIRRRVPATAMQLVLN